MVANRARPEIDVQSDVALRCKDFVGIVEYDGAGNPVVFRRRCANRVCCPRRDGFIAVHRFTISGVQNERGVGEFVTEYVAVRPVSEFLAAAERQAGTG